MSVRNADLDSTWEALSSNPEAVLVDVRTQAEWSFVGTPDLSSIGKQVRLVEWTMYPAGSPNPHFVDQATDGLDPNQPIYLVCRSGARSMAAGQTLEAAGFSTTFNVSAGFEGDLDDEGHRHGGWKDSLPWRQQ